MSLLHFPSSFIIIVVTGPAFASKPHFLDADPVYRQMVDGIPPPNRTLHDTTLDIEPYTGAGMVIHQRLQVRAESGITSDYICTVGVSLHQSRVC